MRLTDESIQKTLEQYYDGSDGQLYYCYGYVLANAAIRMIAGAWSGFFNKYYLIGVTKKQMIFVEYSALGNEKNHKTISLDTIRKVKISNAGFGLQKKIVLTFDNDAKITINANKVIVGVKNLGQNVNSICDILTSLNA